MELLGEDDLSIFVGRVRAQAFCLGELLLDVVHVDILMVQTQVQQGVSLQLVQVLRFVHGSLRLQLASLILIEREDIFSDRLLLHHGFIE